MSNNKTIAVIGAGQMGSGIAEVALACGFHVILNDEREEALFKAKASIEKGLQKSFDKKLIQEPVDEIIKRFKASAQLDSLKSVDIVIEAIVENAEIKCELFKKLDEIVQPKAIFCSNTSSISITKLAGSTNRPDKVIGMHFMNPVPVMKLVEVIRALQTSSETYKTIDEISKQMGKTVVDAFDTPGFIVNRILCPMLNEAFYLLQEGVSAESIDNAMKLGTNQPMGPLALADFVGLDTLLFILKVLHTEIGEDKYRPCPLLARYVEAGWVGKKSGRGVYRY